MHKKITYSVFTVLLFIMASKAMCADFIRGADISIQTRQDADGVVYRENGVAKDAVVILKNHDFNWIRIRIFHTPSNSSWYGVCQDLNYVTALATRVKAQGFKFLLDFHYSDDWADPGSQDIPAAWAGYSHSQLVTAVHDYTRDVIIHLRNNGVMPEMVQIGNEIIGGMLWPDGQISSGGWTKFADLVKAGIAGVNDGRGTEAMPEIMIHIDRGGDWGSTEWFFENLIAQGVVFDVIGQSYYPEWHGTLDNMQTCLDGMAANYTQDVVYAEVGDFYTGTSGQTPASQKAIIDGVIERLEAMPNGQGRGLFYWEPTWVYNESNVAKRALFQPISGDNKNVEMLIGMTAFDTDDPGPQQTLSTSSTSGGSVITPGEGDFQYEQDSNANIEAEADSYYHFTVWSGSAVTAGKVADPCAISTTVFMDANYAVAANFEANPPDFDPPTPNPATWASVPTADSSLAISMTATTGSDASGPVEYYFDETSGNAGGSDSGWQTSSSYTDTGLIADTQYTYRVQMRDSLSNTGSYSTSQSATTQSGGPITLESPSFEDDGSHGDFTPTGWTWNGSGGRGIASGGTDGAYYYWQGNGATLYQTTNSTITAQGVEYTLTVDVRNSWQGSPKAILYYADGGNRVELASASLPANGDSWTNWDTISFSALSTAASVGNNIGIELTLGNYPGNYWSEFDNVALSGSGGGDTTAPAAPTSLSATAGSETVSLDWNNNSEGDLAGYNVYRSTPSGGDYSKLNSSLVSSSDYIDNTVTNGIPYYYVVTAVDTASNESGYSSEASSIPEYQNCADVQNGGDGLLSDLNGDCFVNFEDLEIVSRYWLNPDCSSSSNCEGADFAPTDNTVDFLDFSNFAEQWMQCNKPQTTGCTANW